jgi:phosphoesterase RecJ-like protein
MLQDVLNAIRPRQKFVLTSHARPDGDAIGSALACGQILRLMGKEAQVVMKDPVPRIYRRLPFADHVVHSDSIVGEYDAALLLECDSIQRTRLQGLDDRFLISIDHHISGRNFAHVNWIDPSAVATGELVYRLACAAGVTITAEIATCLYTALLTDTGSFMFEGTNAHTFALARELVLAGAARALRTRHLFRTLHRQNASAWGRALESSPRRIACVDLDYARTDGAFQRERRRLRRISELRALDWRR